MHCCGPQLSVIVPLAPGEGAWTGLLEQLRGIPPGSEVILVRAVPEPLELPKDWPPSLRLDQCQGEHGRARQMNAGAHAACGRWLWFLHADSRLTETTLPALRAFLARGRDGLGFFRLGFLRDGPRLTALNALGANLRSRWLGLPFGDQGFVLPAHWFHRLGGYDEGRAFGEDHQLVWQARGAALPLILLRATVLTSARKYGHEGWLATSLRHVYLTLRQAAPAWYSLHRGARP